MGALAGRVTVTANNMANSDKDSRDAKIKQVIEILRFILTIDDQEIIASSIESVIEQLEEEVG